MGDRGRASVAIGAAATAVLPSGQVLVMGGAPDPNSNAQVRQAAMYTPYTAPSKPLAVSAAASTNSALVTFAPRHQTAVCRSRGTRSSRQAASA